MSDYIIWAKIIFLFCAIWMGSINVLRAYAREDIPPVNIIIMSAGITGFVVLQWHLYLP